MHRYVPPFFDVDASRLAALARHFGKLRADRIGEADVRHQPVAEESRDAAARAIEELIRNHEVERLVLLLQRSDRAQRNDPLHAERSSCPRYWRGNSIPMARCDARVRAAPETPRACPPASRPRSYPKGLPHGVSMSTSSCASNPGIEYSPLPPMIPMLLLSNCRLRILNQFQ